VLWAKNWAKWKLRSWWVARLKPIDTSNTHPISQSYPKATAIRNVGDSLHPWGFAAGPRRFGGVTCRGRRMIDGVSPSIASLLAFGPRRGRHTPDYERANCLLIRSSVRGGGTTIDLGLLGRIGSPCVPSTLRHSHRRVRTASIEGSTPNRHCIALCPNGSQSAYCRSCGGTSRGSVEIQNRLVTSYVIKFLTMPLKRNC